MSDKKYTDDDIRHYVDIVMEHTMDGLKAQFEIIDDIREKVSHIPKMREDIEVLKADMFVVKKLLKTHDQGIKQLQTAAHSH